MKHCPNCNGRGYRIMPSGFFGIKTYACTVCHGLGEIPEALFGALLDREEARANEPNPR